MALKVTKKEMLDVFIDAGLSIIDAEMTFDSKENFKSAMGDILEKSQEIDIEEFKK